MDKGNKPNRLLWILGIAAVAAFLIILGLYIAYFKNLSVTNDSATWGTFGDYLGGTLNPIISFLALIGLLYTIHQQAQEMQATREELKQAAEQQRRQSEIFNLQQFESTFFSLLDQHNNIIENLIESKISDLTNITINEEFRADRYIKDNIRQNPLLKRYFIILFQILKIISLSLSKDIEGKTGNNITINDFSHDNQKSKEKLSNLYINPQEKIYSNIIRAFIPNYILKLLIFNCLPLDDKHEGQNSTIFYNFQGLINRYNFLEHLNLCMPIIHNYDDIIQNNNDFIWFFNVINPIENLKKSFGYNNLFYDIKNFQDIKYKIIKIINDGISILNKEIDKIPEPTYPYSYLKTESETQKNLIRSKIKKLDNIKKFLENKENNLS
jgi:hypothetical protein